MSIELIIFDCDGVLVDSEFVSSRIFSETLSFYGYPISTEECIKRFTGISEHACRQMIYEEKGLDLPEDYWSLAFPALQEAFKTELNSLMHPVLKVLEEQKIARCVASNSSKKHVMHCLEFTDQLKYFSESAIFTASQVKKPKPAPDLFLFAAKEMGVKPENCLVIEDSMIGAAAAHAAGMQVYLFLGGSHAQFEWYQTKIAACNQPMMPNIQALSHAIQKTILEPA